LVHPDANGRDGPLGRLRTPQRGVSTKIVNTENNGKLAGVVSQKVGRDFRVAPHGSLGGRALPENQNVL